MFKGFSFKDQAEVLGIADHYHFLYVSDLRRYLKKFRPELLYTLDNPAFRDRVKSRFFRKRVSFF